MTRILHEDLVMMLTMLVLCAGLGCAQAPEPPVDEARCEVAARDVSLREVREASGLALGRRQADLLWTHNDSGAPVLFALDTQGRVVGRVTVTGAKVEDWEDIASADCPGGSCLYIADIGDNNAVRRDIAIYRVREPAPGDAATAPAEMFRAAFPDGPRDAEAIFVAGGRLYLVTKGETGPVELYRFPALTTPGAALQLERVGEPLTSGSVKDDQRITGAAASPDGRWIVLRTHDALSYFATAELTAGRWNEARRTSLREAGERQGEGVAVARDGTVYLVGEGGGEARGGTFVRISCAP